MSGVIFVFKCITSKVVVLIIYLTGQYEQHLLDEYIKLAQVSITENIILVIQDWGFYQS